MFTLDSLTTDITSDPRAVAIINPLCRSTVRVDRWGAEPMRDFLARPVQRVIVESCHLIKQTVWADCDDDLRAAISGYLERANG